MCNKRAGRLFFPANFDADGSLVLGHLRCTDAVAHPSALVHHEILFGRMGQETQYYCVIFGVTMTNEGGMMA